MKKKNIEDNEIAVLERAIYYIKKGWGANCKDYAEQCMSCEAKRTVNLLKKSIKYAKEN